MTPRNHLLQVHDTAVDCNDMLQPAYLLNKKLYALHPALITIEDPDKLSLKASHSWIYQAPANLKVAGIHSQKQLR